MDAKRSLSTLARQIEIARNRSDFGEDPDELAGAIFHSLRVTYLALSTGLDPRKDIRHRFLLTVSHTGDHLLLQGGQPVPVNGPYLASLFWGAGLDLLPGQLLLVEPEIAKAAIEEALGGLSLEQALVERDRLRRREALDGALALPPQGELDELRVAEERSNLLWDRKIDLVAASLLADEYLERARALADPGSTELEAA
jgi:hypothetical protein